jgi:hypothetical protein
MLKRVKIILCTSQKRRVSMHLCMARKAIQRSYPLQDTSDPEEAKKMKSIPSSWSPVGHLLRVAGERTGHRDPAK